MSAAMKTMLFHWNTIDVLGFFTPTTLSTKPSYKASSKDEQQQQGSSFAVSYLINSCGLSPQAAVSVSNKNKNKLNFHSSQNPNSVLALLTKHGFSQTQISQLAKAKPELLTYNPEMTLLPKIQFLSSIGISSSDLARGISSNPTLLTSSLEKQMVPCYNFLRIGVQPQDEQVITAFKCNPRLFSFSIMHMSRNIALLRQVGVPQSSLPFLFTKFPQVAVLTHTKFARAVEDARQMGFDPSKITFVLAIRVLHTMTDSKWESKYEIFGKWGWSNDDTIQAFKKFPLIMNVSDKKIAQVFDFLVNKMGWAWASKQIARRPETLS